MSKDPDCTGSDGRRGFRQASWFPGAELEPVPQVNLLADTEIQDTEGAPPRHEGLVAQEFSLQCTVVPDADSRRCMAVTYRAPNDLVLHALEVRRYQVTDGHGSQIPRRTR